MATVTSPDNIPIPTSGDAVSPLEAIFAAQSTALQTALTALRTQLGVQGNYYRGTNAQMTAQLSTVPRGAYWFNTTNNTTYRRGTSSWVPWDEPDWTSVPTTGVADPATNYAAPAVRVVGGTVHFRGAVMGKSGAAVPAFSAVVSMPTNYQPGTGYVTTMAFLAGIVTTSNGGTPTLVPMRLYSSVALQLQTATAAGSYLHFSNISWPINLDV